MPGGQALPIHLTEAGSEVARETFESAVTAKIGDESVLVMEPHEIVSSKLIAEREDDPERYAKDIGDIRALNRLGHIDHGQLRTLLRRRAGREEGGRHFHRFLEFVGEM